ncbi:hypothetical protein ODZ84_17780 [Chryseobacterium fluminis]|uniref:hypothetical protein n=1 Tax=Chryseobacterium fluminis TaxID=2983606 RepID=UPI00224FE5A5|nr:hypothetical protein [Chryseobacterium sp. MMS21-Ot14]UZT97034.1 hypothetical protein ODZ84_17780 [Chryseobacterium sp. MMS21-Ot14]
MQIGYLIKAIAFFWLIAKILSYKTWVTERVYPVIPPLEILKNIPDFLHYFLFVFSVLLLVITLFFRRKQVLLIVLFLSELLSCSLDTVRWQPWEYMYLCFLLIIIINDNRPKNILLLSHLFLVSIYFFSGLHKVGRDFLSEVWLNMVLVDFLGISMDVILKYKLFFIGLIIPFVEIALALLLLVPKLRKKVSYFLILMHLSILIFIGPFGLQYNTVIWPWNLAMICILLIVYAEPFEPAKTKMFTYHLYWLILWFVLPFFSLSGGWYQYLSFNLYSGKGDKMYICISGNPRELRPFLDAGTHNICKTEYSVNLHNWALKEIKSVPVPEIEIYEKIAVYLKHKYSAGNLKIMLYNHRTQKRTEL